MRARRFPPTQPTNPDHSLPFVVWERFQSYGSHPWIAVSAHRLRSDAEIEVTRLRRLGRLAALQTPEGVIEVA